MYVFGNDFFFEKMKNLVDSIYYEVSNDTKKGKNIRFLFFVIIIFIMTVNSIKITIKKILKKSKISKNDNIPSLNLKVTHLLTDELKEKFNNSIRISYIGDLILLKKQVISAFDKEKKKYDFNDIFKYTTEHFKKSDLTIGTFEGPTAGGGVESYSTSDYDDGISLYLNFPDEFAEAVKNAGINFVSTGNNHLLDKGIQGAMRTLDILDKIQLNHIGSYRNIEEKEKKKIQILNVQNVKIAFLSYIQFVNYYSIEYLYKNYPFISSFLPSEDNKYYSQMYDEIKSDIHKAKN